MLYNPAEKPDPTVCPRQFCFFWRRANWNQKKVPAGERLYATEGDCLCEFGTCTRLDPEHGDHDWYEPDEPDLEEAGLPWFYYIGSPNSLVPQLKEKYMLESEALWGREHWRVQDKE